MNVRRWPRGQVRPLSEHFSAREFQCNCGICSGQFIDQDLIDKLEEVRALLGAPITVTSGYRCARKQQMLRAQGYETSVGQSTHEQGKAADIKADDMDKLRVFVDMVFNSYGVAKSFIHVDLRPRRADGSKRTWKYT